MGPVKLHQRIAAGSLSIGLVDAMAAPASAADKFGEIYRSSCTMQPADPWVRSLTTGNTDIKGPGLTTYYNYRNGSTLTERFRPGTYSGGEWHVTTTGILNNGGTYGYCRNP